MWISAVVVTAVIFKLKFTERLVAFVRGFAVVHGTIAIGCVTDGSIIAVGRVI